ncbi:dihydrofolate reductase [Carboxylicivirga sediminis]|uniref:Dihydrofolate reductase n=1 Tax=Carboxylicivirga sediminis TaxID=2006564 RepID=A0A941IWU4_9BACT|nr:dihydrofolate reductase [Carboxylicivirga sediminis]MBR8534868.1 dihydrofolate reductase [Carboxylicivirga sediminis]
MASNNFQYQVEQFADLRILRYRIPGFDDLDLQKKLYIYYLSEAALAGRDIIWDQHNEYNLWLRDCLDVLYYSVDKTDDEYTYLEIYYKRVLFSNGMHHHYSTDKLVPQFSPMKLKTWVEKLSVQQLEHLRCSSHTELFEKLELLLFNEQAMAKRVCQDDDKDLILHSANNFYKNLTQDEAENFYKQVIDKNDAQPVSHGLNSRLIKHGNEIKEEVWCINGKYSAAIERIVHYLNKAAEVCENQQQQKVIKLLCDFYTTGDLKLFDNYSIEWLKEQSGEVDFINGFIEVYGDSLGFKATWESLVNITDKEETDKASVISANAQWFEDHSPVMDNHRKEQVSGVSMKVINAIMLGGDCYPASPLGINLPNAEWIREVHGSKSVSLNNISEAYEMASLTSGVIEEFACTKEEIELHKKYGALADHLHTHLHECVGHGSGKLEPGVRSDDLKAYGSVIEEARADLFGLYFMADEKMMELDLVPNMDVAKAQYNSYIRNGLMVQLARINKGSNIEQAHMRNRQLIAKWVLEHGQAEEVIKQHSRNNKTYYQVNNYEKLRQLFGQLLREVQRIKSQGDYEAARKLVETYGVKVDKPLHEEVLNRYAELHVAPYSGFVNPKLEPLLNNKGEVVDITVSYDENFIEQMMRYNRDYHYLSYSMV